MEGSNRDSELPEIDDNSIDLGGESNDK